MELEIKEYLKQHGFNIIELVEYDEIRQNGNDYQIKGGINEFILSAKNLGIKNIFLQINKFSEDEFYYYNEDEGDPIYIPKEKKEINEYKKYIGKISQIRLFLLIEGLTLNYYIVEDWYSKYQIEFIDTLELLLEKRSGMKDATKKEKGNKRNSLK